MGDKCHVTASNQLAATQCSFISVCHQMHSPRRGAEKYWHDAFIAAITGIEIDDPDYGFDIARDYFCVLSRSAQTFLDSDIDN
jgi:hypothetical protein